MNLTSFKLINNIICIYILFTFSNCQNDLCRLFYVMGFKRSVYFPSYLDGLKVSKKNSIHYYYLKGFINENEATQARSHIFDVSKFSHYDRDENVLISYIGDLTIKKFKFNIFY
jgi:hypothetical protein